MLVTSSPAPAARARRLITTFYLYVFLDDFVLLYPVYALLFTDTGLSVAEISSLFVVWSLTGIVLEVPSGVWADAVSRRLLLAGGPLLGAVGFGLWVAAPSYWVFALGFVLWGARGALQSGASEALLYDELDRLGRADRYGRVIGRASTIGLLGVLLAIAVAAPVFAAGGYPAVGVASVLASLLCAIAGLALPENRGPDARATVPTSPGAGRSGLPSGSGGGPDPGSGSGTGHPDRTDRTAVVGPEPGDDGGAPDDGGSPGHLAILRAALAEARANRAVRRALLVLPAMSGIWGALEEYVSLLAREVATASSVPLLVFLVSLGIMVGGLLTPIGQRLATRRFAVLVASGATALAVGALSGRPAGFVLVAVAFGALQMASLVTDVRLQESITGPGRATVTSLAGLGTELVTIGVYGGYALASAVAGHQLIFAVLALPYLVIAVGLGRAGAAPGTGTGAGPVGAVDVVAEVLTDVEAGAGRGVQAGVDGVRRGAGTG